MSAQSIDQAKAAGLIEDMATRKAELKEQYEDIGELNEDVFPPLLVSRCKEWNVNPAVFSLTASFHRVLIAQIHDWDVEPIEGSNGELWKPKGGSDALAFPKRALDRKQNESPRGILITAGLKALEQLHTNGIELGDYVRLLRLVPYRMPIGINKDMSHQYLIVCSASDIIASEDCMDGLRAGTITRKWVSNEHFDGYVYSGKLSSGKTIPGTPINPDEREDF